MESATPQQISARIILDSVSPAGARLVTLETTFPRYVLAELGTHRMLSRNSASSRAIPIAKMIDRARRDPVVPIEFGTNQAGMQAGEPVSDLDGARTAWLVARDRAVESAEQLAELGIHKQIVNRVLEPYLWHQVLITGTDFEHFFRLRISPAAQPEMQALATAIRDAIEDSTPTLVPLGGWHLPLVSPDERLTISIDELKCISTARCARISYLTHDGLRDTAKDLKLFERLRTQGHWSPFEHIATPLDQRRYEGNFFGWKQFRKFQTNEYLHEHS